MSLNSVALKFAAPSPHPESFERFLFIGPHPDDIEIGAGATIAALAAEGRQISFLICTDGRFGLENAPKGTTPQELVEIRKKESIASAAVLGVRDVRFSSLSDGALYSADELFDLIARTIGEVQPDIVFAPDPFVASECHADHLNVGEAARRAAYFAPYAEIMDAHGAMSAPVKAIAFYMTAKPNRFVKTAGLFEKQMAALRCHASQFPEGSEALSQVERYLKLRSVTFGLRSLKGRAEGFRVLGQTQMHCLPEAGL